jgi:EF hand
MKSSLLFAAMLAATIASAQTSLTLPNNSAGTALDTPPVLPATPDALPPRSDPAPRAFETIDARRRGYVTREDLEQLKDRDGFNAADLNGDGRLDAKEFQRYWDAANKTK